VGNLNWAFLNNVAFDAPAPTGYAGTIPHQVFMILMIL
jgi:Amt family ammonium transporter